MNEIVLHAQPQATTTLVVGEEQTYWSDDQVRALQHIGVEDASPADLTVFFHQVKRTGLDPFARQIYMIGRKSGGKVKQTIQTGIDGFRLIGRRAADRMGHKVDVAAPLWAHPERGWVDVWNPAWGNPLAARVTITRDGGEFTATANFTEYAQTKYDGGLTQMWKQRPAGQIAKCAEAAAWRMAFPQDLSGIYEPSELDHETNPETVAPVRDSALRRAAGEQPAPVVIPDPVIHDLPTAAEIAACTDLTQLKAWWSVVDPALQFVIEDRAAEVKAAQIE